MVFTWIFVVSALNSIYIRRGLDSKQTSNNSVTAFNNLNQYVFVTSCLCDCHTVHVYMYLLVTIQYTCTTSVNHDNMTTSKSLVTFAAILQQHGAPISIWHIQNCRCAICTGLKQGGSVQEVVNDKYKNRENMHNVSSIYMYVICLHTLCFTLIFFVVFSLVYYVLVVFMLL